MGIGTSDGQYFDDHLEYLVASSRGSSDKKMRDAQEIAGNETSGDFRSRFGGAEQRPLVYITDPRPASGMPSGASTEPTGALNPDDGTLPPEKVSDTEIRPEPYGLNPPEGNAIQTYIQNIENSIKDIPNVPEKFKKQLAEREALSGGKKDFAPEDFDRALDIAMNFGGAGTMAGVRSAGMKAKLSDLGHAQILEANGIHADDIFTTTGFFRGADNRWRYEIDDSVAKFHHDRVKPGSPKYLSEVYYHPELYKAYPDLKYTKVVIDPELVGARAQAQGGAPYIELGGKALSDGRVAAKDRGILAHEIQHLVQDIEGFAKGAFFEGPADSVAARYYIRSAGEVEARNVDTRLLLSQNRRRSIPPTWSEDVPRSQQIPTKGVGAGTEQGLEDTMTGALTRSADVKNLRKASNDNSLKFEEIRDLVEKRVKEGKVSREAADDMLDELHAKRIDVYNPNDRNMIGSKEIDDAIDKSWNEMVKNSKRKEEILKERARIIAKRDVKEPWNDIERARYKKLMDEYEELNKQ